MSSQAYRGAVVAANLGLVLGIAVLGFRTFKGTPAGPGESAPDDFSPTRYEIKNEGLGKSSIDEHAATWNELDRPKPVVIAPPPPPAPERVTLSDLESRYLLVMASYNPKEPKLSSFIVQPKGGGGQVALGVGDPFDGYVVTDVTVQGDGDSREAVVTFEQGAEKRTIRLSRRSQP